MSNSRLTRKCKFDSCKLLPLVDGGGYCFLHESATSTANRITKKKKAIINKTQARRVRALNTEEGTMAVELQMWFRERRQEMTGICACGCGERTSKDDDKLYKFSIAHVLSKSIFKSVAVHPENFLELAFWTGCHSVLDDKGYGYCRDTKPLLWKHITEKFRILYPRIKEKSSIPEVLLQTLEIII